MGRTEDRITNLFSILEDTPNPNFQEEAEAERLAVQQKVDQFITETRIALHNALAELQGAQGEGVLDYNEDEFRVPFADRNLRIRDELNLALREQGQVIPINSIIEAQQLSVPIQGGPHIQFEYQRDLGTGRGFEPRRPILLGTPVVINSRVVNLHDGWYPTEPAPDLSSYQNMTVTSAPEPLFECKGVFKSNEDKSI